MVNYEKVPLRELLEVIQHNLASDIDSLYSQFTELIGKEKEHNLGFRKEQLKGRIERYLKVVVKNIIYQINNLKIDNFSDTFILKSTNKELESIIKIPNDITKYLNEAIKD